MTHEALSSPLPPPLTPPESDLRGLPFMPLDVERLADSDMVALSSGDEFKAALLLILKSWTQRPAGSLPDDDRVLARLSGAGNRWPRLRSMALHGWQRCADGRLYHAVVAEKACQAWAMRLAQRSRARARWEKHASSALPPDMRAQMQGTGTEKGTERDKNNALSHQAGSHQMGSEGCRLPPDWQPGEEEQGFASSLGLRAEEVLPRFRDYWQARSGASGLRRDWSATWRIWCRGDAERSASASPSSRNRRGQRAGSRQDALLREHAAWQPGHAASTTGEETP
ncbi:putative cytosolic protein [Granulibacter bethesdensis]|uniref:Cytosolic protein n=1 Tax=Granulibacter bethesdensis TaxID=364410 RepID=A0AAC9KAN7_9PROT|nr:YdaU family protein [Granulibacter bethesdensis]APH54882.1 putative cytosolic protein [Granulibacter bethesdensis]APH62468.1 putative cytosolic protein [Granulibacter bethesdensis]